MAQTYFPFDAGAGANITEAQWQQMAQFWLNTGVIKGILNEFQAYADSTGMQVKVKSGNAWMKGHFFQSDADVILPIATSDSTNPRIDRIVIRVDWTANTIALAVLQGTPAGSPVAPALTQNSSRWEISLAQVYVGKSVTTIAAGNITDERNFVKNANTDQGVWIFAALQNGWGNLSGYGTVSYRKDEFGIVHLIGVITTGTTTDGTTILTLPIGYRPIIKKIFPAVSDGAIARVDVLEDGRVQVYGAKPGYFTLSKISFPTDA